MIKLAFRHLPLKHAESLNHQVHVRYWRPPATLAPPPFSKPSPGPAGHLRRSDTAGWACRLVTSDAAHDVLLRGAYIGG